MSRTRPFIIAILVSLFACPTAPADVLRTLDGKVYEGQIKFDSGDMLTMQQTTGSAVRVKLADVLSASFRAITATAQATATPNREPIRGPWAPREVGKPPAGGVKRTATKVTLQAGTLTESADVLPFFARPVKGDFSLMFRITEISTNDAVAGIMLRSGPEPDALTYFASISGGADGQETARPAERYLRDAKGKPVARKADLPKLAAPLWMRVTREGEYVEVSTSTDGGDWKVFVTERLELPETLLVGMACIVKEPAKAKPAPSKDGPALPHATFESLRLVESAQAGTTGLRGQYYATDKFTDAKLTRVDPTIDFTWGSGPPGEGVPNDSFSTRWAGRIRVPLTGKYRLHGSADDSITVWVNGTRLFERGGTRELSLRGGQSVPIRIDYVENGGEARVKLEWESEKVPRQVIPTQFLIPAEGDANGEAETGLRAEYFMDANLTNLQLVRTDSEINFQQPNSPADESLNAFSVRWTGTLVPPSSGNYTFYTFSDDGVRLWVNNKQLIENWQMNPGVEDSGSIQLRAAEPVAIRMESFNGAGGWAARLMWDGPEVDKQVIPRDRFQTPGEELGTRILTRDGSELTGVTLEQMDDTTMRFKRANGEPLSLPVARVARLSTRPLTSSLLERIPDGSFGVLLANGDFFDGEIQSAADGKLIVNSLIFGPRTLDLRKEVAALVLQDARPEPANYVVKTVDGSIYMANEVAVDGGKLTVTDRAAGKVTVAADTVRDIAYGGARVAPLVELSADVMPDGAMKLDGTPVGVSAQLFDYTPARAIGLSSGAAVTYALDGKYETLLATTGVPKGLLPTSALLFTATADGKEIFRSPPLTSLSDSLPISLKLNKVKRLTLKVEPADPTGPVALPGVWADPLLTKP